MASNFRPTGSYSNLTRLELERLRRADAFASGKVLTIGDSGEGSEDIVGPGRDISIEPVDAWPPFYLEAVNAVTPPSEPGKQLGSTAHVYGVPSETVSWFGPTLVYDAYDTGYAFAPDTWEDDTPGLNYTLFVQPGDLLLVKPTTSAAGQDDRWAVATILSVTANTLVCSVVIKPYGAVSNALEVDSNTYSYLILRPNAVKLFASPWSGTTGQEQTFFAVNPGASVNSMIAPTVADLLADAVPNLVEPSFATSGDRADGVYGAISHLLDLGYRVVLYPDDGSGSGPDLTQPILATHPVIDPAIPSEDQDISIDYRMGTVRLSCAPAVGGDIKPSAGCVDAATGRLNLYAVFWAVDTSLTKQTAAGIHVVRGDEYEPRPAAKIWFDSAVPADDQAWWVTSSSSQRGFFVYDKEDEPALFGVSTKVAGEYRSFTYDNDRSEWRMLMREYPPDKVHDAPFEPSLADRTVMTISDSSFEPQHPGAITPSRVIAAPKQGFRNSADDIEAALFKASLDGYGIVHLRKGVHRLGDTLLVPPGTTLEGSGPQTRLEVAEGNKPAVKFGPNTPWGVYDFGYRRPYSSSYLYPSLLNGIKNRRVEGQDVCWNPNKKVWAIVTADVASQSVWFNEMGLDGFMVFAGDGIEIKQNGRPLMTVDTTLTNASQRYHTPGHSPRIAYHPVYNRYGAAWGVRDTVTTNNAAIQVVLWEVQAANSISRLQDVILEASAEDYTNPSVAFEEGSSSNYDLCVSYAHYTTSTYVELLFINESTQSTQSIDRGSDAIISSTDLVFEDGNVVVVWSERAHPLFGSSAASGIITSDTPRRFTSGDLPNPLGAGVISGSKLHHLNTTTGSAQGGKDFIVTNSTSTYIEIQDERESTELATPEGSVFWAISPPSRILSTRYDLTYGWSSGGPFSIVDGYPSAGEFNAEMREPDFVRVSPAGGSYLVVFQSFNTTGFLARSTLPNFDNDVNTNFYDGNPVCKSQHAYREYVSTCAVLVSGNQLNPDFEGAKEPLATYNVTMEQTLPQSRSLGASEPLVSFANALHLNVTQTGGAEVAYGPNRGPHLEISARHVTHKWTYDRPMSLIPDVTWTGQDWAIVSPTKAMMESDTGTIRIIGGQHYLVDPTFCFGVNANNGIDNNWLPMTFSGWVELPDAAPSTTEYAGTVISEHCILLGSTTPFSDGDKIRWRHIDNQTSLTNDDCRDYGTKILGFRVGSDGKVIQGSSRLLDYLPPQWSPDLDFHLYGGRMETVSRREVYTNITPAPSTGGANAPMCYGALGPEYDPADPAPSLTGSDRGGWGNDYPTSRLSGHVGFRGICAGAPMPPGSVSPYECPMAAIAWGDTFYALAVRQTSGNDSLWENKTIVFRQSFGPYNAEVRNLHIEGKNLRDESFLSLTGIIQAKSRRHVFTRWGLPNAPSGAFATDGYRNCFVYSSQNGQVLDADLGTFGSRTEWEDYTTDGGTVSTVHLAATYTDALGEQPITFRGPGMLYEALYDGTLGIRGMPGGDCQNRDDLAFNPVTGHSPAPVVLWTGSQFASFWTEEDKTPYTNGTAGAYICMAIFPGSNATYIHNAALGDPRVTKTIPDPSAVVKVSCGIGVNAASALGIGGDVFGNQITVCDAAYSGNVFAVVWATGLYTFGNPPYTDAGNLEAGSVIGVTIFTNTSPNGGGTSYLITAENLLGGVRIRQPKIVWDGTNFVLFWSVGTQGQTLSVPESGLGSPIQVKRLASSQMMMKAGVAENQTIGTLDADGNLTIGRVGSDFGLACQPGDIVMIDKTQHVAQLFPERSDGACSGYFLTSATGKFMASSADTRVYEAGGAYGVDNSSDNEFADFSQDFSAAGVQVGSKLVVTAPGSIAGIHTITEVAPGGTNSKLSVREPWPIPPGAVTGVEYYIDQGVQPGDHIIIGTPSPNNGRYIVESVTSDTQVRVTTPFPNVTTGEDFYIERRFDSFEQAGPHVVRGYDPLTGTVGLELRSSTWQEDEEVVGSILSGGLGNNDNLVRYGNMRSPYLPESAVSYSPVQIDSADPGGNYVERMQAVVYMDTEDCFAAAYVRTDASIDVMLLSRTTMQPFQRFHYIANVRSVDLAWNGKNLMLVFAEKLGKIRVILLSPQLVRIEDAILENNIGSTPSSLGQGVGQIPGPLYDALVTSNNWADALVRGRGHLQPRPKKVHVKWNDRLGRWVVSASFVWAMEGTCLPSPGDTVPYANNPPMWPLQYVDSGTILYQPADTAIGGTYVGRVITGRFFVPLIQPGMRIFVTDNGFPAIRFTVMGVGPRVVDPNPLDATPTDIYESITVDVDSSELTAAQVALVTDVGDPQRMWAEPREDVVCWTIQQGEPAVLVRDADGVALRDVTIGGSVVDISEYCSLAQPLWQSVGEFVGGVAVGGVGARGRVIKRPYTQSFLSPQDRVETLRQDNCRSRTPVKYGRHGPPGLPILGVGKPEGRRS